MSARQVWLLDDAAGPWHSFLAEFLEGTSGKLQTCFDPVLALKAFDRQQPDQIFVAPAFLSPPLIQKLKALRASSDTLRIFGLGKNGTFPKDLACAAFFESPGSLLDFQKKLMECLPQPETIRLLVVDDEPEVGAMVRDFLEGRTAPQFTVECAENGEIAFKKIRQKLPDVVLMDIKMSVRDGRELYRDLIKNGLHVPVIVFFDAVSTEELAEIYSLGRPMGGRERFPPEFPPGTHQFDQENGLFSLSFLRSTTSFFSKNPLYIS